MIQLRSIVLASSSPRRQDLLQRYGLEFQIIKPNTDEIRHHGEDVISFVRRAATEKANAVYEELRKLMPENKSPHPLVLSGDTVVVHKETMLGKPKTPDEAFNMLKLLVNQWHSVLTAYVLIDSRNSMQFCDLEETRVKFSDVSYHALKWYAEKGDGMDKAGAYSIQGLGAFLIARIEGSFNNVVGFPIEKIMNQLLQCNAVRFSEDEIKDLRKTSDSSSISNIKI